MDQEPDYSRFSLRKPISQKFFADWSKSLIPTITPYLRESLSSGKFSSTRSGDIDHILLYLRRYYHYLNESANTNNIPYLLFSSWRNSLEKPYLFLGDIHPYILTNLLRSFIAEENVDSDLSELGYTDLVYSSTSAWKNPSAALLNKIEDIEGKMKSMVPNLLVRMGEAQNRFLNRVSKDWIKSNFYQGERNQKTVAPTVDEAAKEDIDDLVQIFVEANNLRIMVISGIVEGLNDHQANQYLEALCKFLPSFTDQVEDKTPILMDNLPPQQLNSASSIFPIFVGDLAHCVNSDMLYLLFKDRYASVADAKVMTHQDTRHSKLHGFVAFGNKEEQQRAIEEMNGHIFYNRALRTGPASRNFF